jgi:flagellar hook-associated protein 2
MISASGIGSGLDVDSIVGQLMAVERQPLAQMDTRHKKFDGQISAYGQIKGTLSTLQAAAKSLSSIDRFHVYAASSTDESVFTASAAAGASPAGYQIEIRQLAQAHKLSAGAVAATTDVIGTGTLSIEFGTHDTVGGTFTANPDKTPLSLTIDSSNNTLAGIRDAINQANAGVSASIINDGSGHRLVISSNDSGAANSLKISTTDGDGNHTDTAGLSFLAHDPLGIAGAGKNLTQRSEARNAEFTVDGIAVSHASNTVTGVIEGVTLNLKKANAGQAETLSIARNTEAVAKAVDEFVKAYNNADKTLRDLTSYNASTQKGAVLQGDSAARSVRNGLRDVLTGSMDNAFATLSAVGVSFQADGTLAVNSGKLNEALATNFEAVGNLFAHDGSLASEKGFALRLDGYLKDVLGDEGALKARTDGINASIKSLEKSQERFLDRLDMIEKRYRAQFTALDSLISSMNTTSAYLSQQLASLQSNNES